MASRESSTIVLATSDEQLAAEIARFLRGHACSCVGRAAEASEALELIALTRPDLVLLDVELAGEMDGVNVATMVRRSLDVEIVFTTDRRDEGTLQRMLETRPASILYGPYAMTQLRATLDLALVQREVSRRDKLMRRTLDQILEGVDAFVQIEDAAQVRERVRERGPRSRLSDPMGAVGGVSLASLSPREREVLGLFLEGWQTTTIGARLHISPQTVRNHLKRAQRRFGVRSQGALREVFARPPEQQG